MTKSRSQFIAITTVLSLALLESSARAQEERNHVIVGLGAGYAPAYEGADKYRVLPISAIDVQWGRFFANLRKGVGINIIDTKFVTLGTSVMFMPGYRREDAPEGIGKLSNGAGGRAFLSLEAGGLVATVGGTRGVVGDSMGTVADANLSATELATADAEWRCPAASRLEARTLGDRFNQQRAFDLAGECYRVAGEYSLANLAFLRAAEQDREVAERTLATNRDEVKAQVRRFQQALRALRP